MSCEPVGILLAAGSSRRFGNNKLVQPVVSDTPMLLVSAKNLVDVLPDSIAVISKEVTSLTPQLESLGLRVVLNEQAATGIGSSIACGVRASAGACSWLIALADMPYIKQETLGRLVERLRNGARIVAPVYAQQRGHPVGFHRQFQQELLALHNDIGAREVIHQHRQELELLATEDAGVITDIDQPADVKMQSQAERAS